MKITGGIFRGTKLFFPPPKDTTIRPLRTRIRKALFDILGDDLTGIKVLDLFAGTGALGFEALSRGAELAVFVDSHELSINLIKKNAEKLKVKEKVLIFKLILPEGVSKLSCLIPNISFDLIFITPPYKANLGLKTLESICKHKNLIDAQTFVIVEEHTEVVLPEKFDFFVLSDKRTYGETTLYFYTVSKEN